MALWPVPVGVTEKSIARCFPCWRHDFIAPLQPSAVNAYTACVCSWGLLMLNNRAGGKRTFTERFSMCPTGRITKKWTVRCRPRRCVVDAHSEGTLRFLSSSLQPVWQSGLPLPVHIVGGKLRERKKKRNSLSMESQRTWDQVPVNMTYDLSTDPSESRFPSIKRE